MSDRDYKNAGLRPRRPRRSRRGAVPLWLWVAAGIVIGGALAFGKPVYRALENTVATLRSALQPPEQGPAPERAITTLEPPEEDAPHFEFYRLLPEMEVVIPAEELETHDQRVGDYHYRLQIGSFLDPADAEALRARCTLLGFEPEITTARIDGRTRYRVRIGPFARAREADTARRRLFDNDIDSIVLRETLRPPEG